MSGANLMNKNECFKQFLREKFPQLDEQATIEAFQYWLKDSGDFRSLDLDDFENAEYDVYKWRNNDED